MAPTGSPSRIPSAQPSLAPTPSPVTPSPTIQGNQPSLAPTPSPTKLDTVQVAVELFIRASAPPTSADKATLKSTIVKELSIDASNIRDFKVEAIEATRLRQRLRRLLSSYTWSVSFSIVVSLSSLNDDSIGSASAFQSSVTTALSSGLESSLAEAGLDVTVESVTASISDDDGYGDNDDGGGSASAAIGAGVGAAGAVLLLAAYAWWRHKEKKKASIQAVLHASRASGKPMVDEGVLMFMQSKMKKPSVKSNEVRVVEVTRQESQHETQDVDKASETEAEVVKFLEACGLSEFTDIIVHECGIEKLQDLFNPEEVGDYELENIFGMEEHQVEAFRSSQKEIVSLGTSLDAPRPRPNRRIALGPFSE
jgi:hypothetical protein